MSGDQDAENSPQGGGGADPEEEMEGEPKDAPVNDQSADQYVETRGPLVPDAVSWLINPVVSTILRSPLHPLLSDVILLLTFTGRRSGAEYSVPVAYWRQGNTLLVTSHGSWWRNLRGGEPVIVRIQGRERTAVATPHPDPEQVAQYMQTFIRERGLKDVHRLGIRVHGDREPTLDELAAGLEGAVVIEIDLDA